MSKMIMIYASMTGNTEEMANAIAEGIQESGKEVEIIDIFDNPSASILMDYEGILLGSYTWGEGDLPDEFLDFYEEMDQLDLSGKKAFVFGSGDTVYDDFAGAVDRLIEKLQERGAEVVLEGLKVDTSPQPEDIEKCKQCGSEFVASLYQNEKVSNN